MRSSTAWLAGVALVAAPALAAAASTVSTRETEVRTRTYSGTVVEYLPAETIVIRDANQQLITYPLTSTVVAPADIEVGRTVTVEVEPGVGGASIVRKVVTTSVGAGGAVETTTTSTLTRSGTVVELLPRKTIVVREPGERVVTYALAPEIVVPDDVVIGSNVTMQVAPTEAGTAVIREITTTAITPEGDVKTTTTTRSSGSEPGGASVTTREKTVSGDPAAGGSVTTRERTVSGDATGASVTTRETTVRGVVSSYVASESLVLRDASGRRVRFVLEPGSTIPGDLAAGRNVTVRFVPTPEERVVRTITYTTDEDGEVEVGEQELDVELDGEDVSDTDLD